MQSINSIYTQQNILLLIRISDFVIVIYTQKLIIIIIIRPLLWILGHVLSILLGKGNYVRYTDSFY